MERTIFVVAEHAEGALAPIAWELVAFARRLQEIIPHPVRAVMVGEGLAAPARYLAENGGVDVTALEAPGLRDYNGEAYRVLLARFFREHPPACVIIGNTAQGLDFGPGLAVRLEAANITGVTGVLAQAGRPLFLRPVYNGKRLARVEAETSAVVVHLQGGAFKPEENAARSSGRVVLRSVALPGLRSRCRGTEGATAAAGGLAEAAVIVAAGNGIGERENIDLLERLAGLFPRSAVAGSRIVCDRGWLPYDRQVGATGARVSPKLYIACGISGAAQHLAGMRNSGFIVAINTDARAAMRQHADICVTEDLRTFIPALIDAFQQEKS